MGFLNNNIDLTIYAKLTPYGRQQLLKSNTSLITKFSLGDSDANYNVDSIISTGSMPTISGNLAVGNFNNNSSSSDFKIKNVDKTKVIKIIKFKFLWQKIKALEF